jgi:hypothetical protein
MTFRKALLGAAAGLALLLGIVALQPAGLTGGEAEAATSFVGPIQTYSCATNEWANSLAASNGATTCTQPAVGNLSAVASGTVLGNPTGSSAAPEATAAPVLGVASTTSGTLGLYSSSTANAITIQNVGATAAYNFNLPNTAGTSGQVLTSAGGGASAMTWSTVLTAAFTVSSKTSAYTVVSGTDDWKRFDNSGASGSVTLTLPASPSAGDNYCFLVVAAQTLEILANTGETITMANVTGSSAGNLQANTVGSSVCIYFESSTTAYAWASEGAWSLT